MSLEEDKEVEAMGAVSRALAELADEERKRVIEWAAKKFGALTGPPLRSDEAPTASVLFKAVVPGPKEFLLEKKPHSDVEKITCLAYFLTHFRDTPEFKTKDLTLLNREAKQPRIGNPTMAVNNATRQNQFLVSTVAGRKQLTIRGEALVEALPDRERVKDVLEATPLSRRKRRRVGGKAAGKP